MKLIFRLMIRVIRTMILLALLAAIIIVIVFKGDIPGMDSFKTHDISKTMQNETHYSLEDNELFKNIPLTQVKNVFDFVDKQEFMDVSGLSRLGFNDDYLIAQRNDDYILYRFGDKTITLFDSEEDLQSKLNQLGQQINLQEKSSF